MFFRATRARAEYESALGGEGRWEMLTLEEWVAAANRLRGMVAEVCTVDTSFTRTAAAVAVLARLGSSFDSSVHAPTDSSTPPILPPPAAPAAAIPSWSTCPRGVAFSFLSASSMAATAALFRSDNTPSSSSSSCSAAAAAAVWEEEEDMIGSRASEPLLSPDRLLLLLVAPRVDTSSPIASRVDTEDLSLGTVPSGSAVLLEAVIARMSLWTALASPSRSAPVMRSATEPLPWIMNTRAFAPVVPYFNRAEDTLAID